MDKEYMLLKCRARLKELRARYHKACLNQNENGDAIPIATAATNRSNLKRDISILVLLEQLLVTSKAVYIEDEEAIDGFDRLVEPVERVIRSRH